MRDARPDDEAPEPAPVEPEQPEEELPITRKSRNALVALLIAWL